MDQSTFPAARTRSQFALALAMTVATTLLWLSSAEAGPATTQVARPTVPWTAAETVSPADLVSEIARTGEAGKPVVVCTAPAFLYRNGHVPGALFHGPASSASGLEDLKNWAQTMSRSANVVLYCGCCPMEECPNVKPAFTALRDLGFTRLRVLILPNNFGTDWVDKGYPVEK